MDGDGHVKDNKSAVPKSLPSCHLSRVAISQKMNRFMDGYLLFAGEVQLKEEIVEERGKLRSPTDEACKCSALYLDSMASPFCL